MSNYPKISIVIPVYGVEKYIADCLYSVIAQDYSGSIECILVDDCSPDNSIEVANTILSHYTGKISFKVIHHNRNMGLSGARNTGLNASTGDYIYFLDSDDELTPTCISALVEPLLTKKYEMVAGDLKVVGSNSNWPLRISGEICGNKRIVSTRIGHKWNQIAPNKLYSLEFIRKLNLRFLEGIIHEDELWSCMVASFLNNMYAVKEQTYIYKIRGNSITTNNQYDHRIESFYKILHKFREHIIENGMYNSIDANDLLQYLFNSAMCIAAAEDKDTYIKAYTRARIKIDFCWGHYIFVNGLSFRRQIRDFHFVLPSKFGAKLYRLLKIRK